MPEYLEQLIYKLFTFWVKIKSTSLHFWRQPLTGVPKFKKYKGQYLTYKSNKMLKKNMWQTSILIKLQACKNNLFQGIFQGFCLLFMSTYFNEQIWMGAFTSVAHVCYSENTPFSNNAYTTLVIWLQVPQMKNILNKWQCDIKAKENFFGLKICIFL